ncbi:hypothetical protein [Vibrio alfacsensis]|uniref:hypothetical protein n=1 Tax=Vibrio TaxID=662 RepID=UPI004067BA38
MTRIAPRHEHFTTTYHHEQLPALFKKQYSDADISESLPQHDSGHLNALVSNSRQTVLIASEQLKEESLIQSIKAQADKGIRVYLLLGAKAMNKAAIDALSGRCLIRTGVQQQGALILVDHATTDAQGLLLMSHSPLVTKSEYAWGIQLELPQIEDSFRSFCKLFWQSSSEEYLHQNQPKSSVQHPDGAVLTNHSHHLGGTLKDCLSDTLDQLRAATHSGFGADGDNWRLLLDSQSNQIATLARHGVALTDKPLPSLLLSSDGHWLLPDETDFAVTNWCLKLSVTQSEKLEQAYDQAFEDAAWQYQDETAIGEFASQQRLRFAAHPELECIVEDNREIELDAIHTQSIDSFLNDDANALASEFTAWKYEQLAHAIHYNVLIHPPYCPNEAKPDNLYKLWENTERDWQKRLDDLLNEQSNIDQQQARISDKLKGFIKGFLLGQGQSTKGLNREIDTLKAWSVITATPAERTEYRQRLTTLALNIRKRGTDTARNMDMAEQNQRWEQQRSNLQQDVDNNTDQLNEKTAELKQLKDNESEARGRVTEEFHSNWVSETEKLTDQQLDSVQIGGLTLEQFMPDTLPALPEPSPKNADQETKQANQQAINQAQADREKIHQAAQQGWREAKRLSIRNMTLDQANHWKASIKDKIWRKHYKNFERCIATYEQGLNKVEREIQAATKALDNIKAEQGHSKKALDEHGSSFVYKSKQATDAFAKQLGLSESKSGDSEFQWPSDELPTNGTELREHQQKRYLVVFEYHQIDQAKLDAQRLNAEIVCHKESEHA